MKDLFLTIVEISISTSFIILMILLFSSYLNRKYAVKWKYFIWIVIALRLIIPINFRLPDQKIVVDVPTQVTTPINVDIRNETPITLQTDHKIAQITLLDIAACLWFVGCSAVDNVSFGVQAQAQVDHSDAVIENLQDTPVVTDTENGQEISGVDTNNGESVKITLSADSEEIVNIMDEFAAAYFSGDINAVKSLLPDSYAWDIEAYKGTGTISDITFKGLPDAGEQEIGSVWTVSMQYRDSTYEDMFQYLTFELMKQSAGWEIQFYGLEG